MGQVGLDKCEMGYFTQLCGQSVEMYLIDQHQIWYGNSWHMWKRISGRCLLNRLQISLLILIEFKQINFFKFKQIKLTNLLTSTAPAIMRKPIP